MLVVVSDLHLQHTSHDSVRFKRGEKYFETGVHRNVTAGAFRLLFETIITRVERMRAKNKHSSAEIMIDLVFAGDIFEIHRTPLWFDYSQKADVRPYAADPTQDTALQVKVEEILKAIEAENSVALAALRTFVTDKKVERHDETKNLDSNVKIKVHFIPGNHDRVVNAWDSTRTMVRRMLRIDLEEEEEGEFKNTFTRSAADGYASGVLIRHGHEYDAHNFPLPIGNGKNQSLNAGLDDYLKPCLGDYVTIDIATRLAMAFRAHNGAKLRDPDNKQYRQLYNALNEFDDVRPMSLLLTYLQQQFADGSDELNEAILPVVHDTYVETCASPFFIKEAKKHKLDTYFTGIIKEIGSPMIRQPYLYKILDKFVKRGFTTKSKATKGPAHFAQYDTDNSHQIVIAGHTHHPECVPMPPKGEKPCMYINSGTWRTSIPCGVEKTFGRIRDYTMVFCYSDSERKGFSDHRQFESWMGHLSEEKSGPYTEEVTELLQPTQRQVVRFTQCKVGKLKERGKAELRLRFGVDDQELVFDRNKVLNDNVFPLNDSNTVELDPNLDGELWAWGCEKDLGLDDPLPWALQRLPRQTDGAFENGAGVLYLRNHQGIAIELSYEVMVIPSVVKGAVAQPAMADAIP